MENLNLKTKTTKVVVSVKTSEALGLSDVSVKTSEAVQVQSTKQVSVKTSEALGLSDVSVKTSECDHKRVTFPNFR
ncbi:hypothetical protein A0Z69_02630 [Campylobacter hyointestinalis]|uniref:hypothetical protein n=1 Tax=Campylobacter hyointestinalis TaxID=198 RepID=UPI0004D6FBE9|nr:hypothetical protein [Campylobacter hyointestinalis]KEA43719.1 hypothetical protein CR67_08425 [Campylobacter hyointestinalis subsp. hyointestinalis]TXK48580.1 hypothetical protein A0Z69_02630 [Campylobacter hyointestinalis]